jgi:hypothetical protein
MESLGISDSESDTENPVDDMHGQISEVVNSDVYDRDFK